MTYANLSISREQDGRQVVHRPRATDVIGHSLRGAFAEPNGLPTEMVRMLQQLDAVGRPGN